MPVPQSIIEKIFYKHPNFWLENGQADFSELGRADTRTTIKFECIKAGARATKTELAEALARIAKNQAIENIYPYLPGYPVGIIPKTAILVPKALEPIQPVAGDFDLIEQVLVGLLGTQQYEYAVGWLKITDQCFRTHSMMPGQVMVLAGPQGGGKTCVQEEIFTPLLGDSFADPYQFVIGRTQFNGPMYRAVHLMMSDQKNPRNREDLREFFRDVASNESSLLHAKGKDGTSIKTLRRLTISCNLTEKDLAIIPPLDGLEEKVMLFKCECAQMPLPGIGPIARKARAAAIRAQLPAFVDFLHQHKIRADLEHERFGIKGFLHPEIEKLVRGLSREDEFLGLIEEHKRAFPAWVLRNRPAGEIYSALYDTEYLRDALRRCCGSPTVAGKLLTGLAGRNNGIVTVSKTSGHFVFYDINP